jgi:hypothetical protein
MNRLAPRPEGVDAKIQRAKRHLAVIKREARAYKESNPEFVEAKLDPNIPGYRLYAKIRPPSTGLSVKMGDFLFDLRSALDHLARGLVETEGNTPVDLGSPRTMFPVFDQPKKLIVSGGIDPNALAIIERLQPYKRPDWWLAELWILHELHNIDKHRTLHFPTAAWVSQGTQVALVEPGPRRHVAVILGRVESGTELGHIQVFPPAPTPDPKVEVYGEFTVEVFMPVFGPQPAPSLPLLDGLQALFGFVSRDVVPLFDPFFR